MTNPDPDWEDGVPLHDDACRAFDGKRCSLMGFRPDRICEPQVKEMAQAIHDKNYPRTLRIRIGKSKYADGHPKVSFKVGKVTIYTGFVSVQQADALSQVVYYDLEKVDEVLE